MALNADTRAGWFYISFAIVGYAVVRPLIKTLYDLSELHPFHILTWRYVIAVPVIWLLVLIWQRAGLTRSVPADRKPPSPLLMMGVGTIYGISVISGFYGLRYLDASLQTTIEYAYPMMVALLMTLLGERLPVRGWFALSCVVVGILFIVPDALNASLAPDTWKGVLFALLSGFSFAVYIVASGQVTRGYPMTMRLAAWNISGLVLFIPFFILREGIRLPETSIIWLLIIAIATVSTVLPMVGVMLGTAKLGASRAAMLSVIEMALSVGLAVLLLGDHPSPIQWSGVWMILVSVIILETPVSLWKPRRRRLAWRGGGIVK